MAQPVTSQEFTAFYLQRTTQEFAEDLDKVREADDFKAESLPFLIHALQQGTALYSTADQARVARAVAPAALAAAKEEDQDVAMDEPQAENENRNSKKEKKEKSKRKKSSG